MIASSLGWTKETFKERSLNFEKGNNLFDKLEKTDKEQLENYEPEINEEIWNKFVYNKSKVYNYDDLFEIENSGIGYKDVQQSEFQKSYQGYQSLIPPGKPELVDNDSYYEYSEAE